MEKEEMINRKRELAVELNRTYLKFKRAESLYFILRNRYDDIDKEYRSIDRKLAMIDGRYQVVKAKEEKRKNKKKEETLEDKVRKMNIQQLNRLIEYVRKEIDK